MKSLCHFISYTSLLILFCFRLCPGSCLHSLSDLPCFLAHTEGQALLCQLSPSCWFAFALEAVKGNLILSTRFSWQRGGVGKSATLLDMCCFSGDMSSHKDITYRICMIK